MDEMKNQDKFLERARQEAAASEVTELPAGQEIIGAFSGLERVQKKKIAKGESENSPIITLTMDGAKKRFWAFGLLVYLLEKHEVKHGDMVYIKKSAEKSKDNFWGCAFYCEHAQQGKGGK